MTTLRFLFARLGRFSRMFWLLLLVGALDGMAGFAIPIMLAKFGRSNDVGLALERSLLARITTCLVATLILQWSLRRWGEALSGWFGNNLRLSLFREAETLSLETLSHHHSGYIAPLINQVAGAVGSTSTTIIWLIGHLTTTLILFFIFTARESLNLACANTLLLGIFVVISVALSRRIVPLADTINTTAATLAERFIDLLTNISTVKRLGIIDWAERKLHNETSTNNRAIEAFQRFHANRWLLLHSIFFTAYLMTIAFLVHRIELKSISASILILFIAGFATVRGHAERLAELIKGLIETGAYVTRLEALLKQSLPSGHCPVSHLKVLECHAVRFQYPHSNHQITIPEFVLRAGERVLITGRSGQGKSTLLALLANQRQAVSGQLQWNGLPYTYYNQSLQHSFALVSQEAELFNLSLRENLTLGRPVSDSELHSLLTSLDLADLLASLPSGLDTVVGEKALRLSAGQKQRINIARALLLNRPVLLLDEPTAHLDPASEAKVIDRLSQIDSSTAVVVVSHRADLQTLCSRHYKFNEGTLSPAS